MTRDLEQQYRLIIEELRSEDDIITIELSGFPRTGKSLFADALRGLLVKCDASVTVAPRDTWDCPIEDKWSFDYSVWTLSTLIHAWLDAKYRKTDIFVADRGWFDALLWAELKLQLNLASQPQVSALRQWIMAERIWPARLIILAFSSDDQAAILSRGKERRLHAGESRVTTERNLELLASAIGLEMERAVTRGAIAKRVDVSGRTVEGSLHLGADQLLAGLRRLADERRHRA